MNVLAPPCMMRRRDMLTLVRTVVSLSVRRIGRSSSRGDDTSCVQMKF